MEWRLYGLVGWKECQRISCGADRGWSSTEMQCLVSRGEAEPLQQWWLHSWRWESRNAHTRHMGSNQGEQVLLIDLHCYPSSIRPKRLTPAGRWKPNQAALHLLHWWWWQEWDFSIPGRSLPLRIAGCVLLTSKEVPRVLWALRVWKGPDTGIIAVVARYLSRHWHLIHALPCLVVFGGSEMPLQPGEWHTAPLGMGRSHSLGRSRRVTPLPLASARLLAQLCNSMWES